MLAVAGSCISNMSEASMPFQPAIDDPSNAWPELNLSSSKCETGTVTCCSFPRVSEKRKSTNLTSFSFTIFITSATLLAAISYLLVGWLLKIWDVNWDAVSVPKLVHGTRCEARRLSPILSAFPYRSLALLDEQCPHLVRRRNCTALVP